ncbi:hypothetical protein [Methylobacterium isbiliense]|jgi:hypothetical protein|uniref:Uncharacterized protein n=1 Tax=Methylobacterium isbiliense TaxID=315478 RepID=A0ABQ4SHI5_9HYPH|nr:hypothetical protein [Methylobacterium isbiliense]MDN3627760.1 hypothetical protein [Methylobacterium isbiliense]GJE02624.1 hypothetical protein GMJLKIPL_4573 [Methylobacterium isbiliense]
MTPVSPLARETASPAPALWESVPLECLAAALFIIAAAALQLAGILP